MQKANDDIYILVLLGMAGTIILCAAVVLFYLRYQRRFYRQRTQLQQAELAHQVSLLHATIQSQEVERKRIGRDLHDDVGAALANMRFAISNIAGQESADAVRESVLHCRQLSDDIMNRVRAISHSLSPPGLDMFGLSESMEDLCSHTAKHAGLHIYFNNSTGDDALLHIAPDVSIALYRVLQELLTNTIKHAGAAAVNVLLERDGPALIMHYRDDGKGINLQHRQQVKGMGMQNIETRLNMVQATYETGTGAPGFGIHIQVPGIFTDTLHP